MFRIFDLLGALLRSDDGLKHPIYTTNTNRNTTGKVKKGMKSPFKI